MHGLADHGRRQGFVNDQPQRPGLREKISEKLFGTAEGAPSVRANSRRPTRSAAPSAAGSASAHRRLLHHQPDELVAHFAGVGLDLGERHHSRGTPLLAVHQRASLARHLHQPPPNLCRQLRLPVRSLRLPWSSVELPTPNSADVPRRPSPSSDSSCNVRRASPSFSTQNSTCANQIFSLLDRHYSQERNVGGGETPAARMPM